MSGTSSKPRYILFSPPGGENEVERYLSSPLPENDLAVAFAQGRLEAVRRSKNPIPPPPGSVSLDLESGVVNISTGQRIAVGVPSVPCPDCGGDLRLSRRHGQQKAGRSAFIYLCENRSTGCRASAPAKADGTLVGVPGDAKTREARQKTRDFFDTLWRRCPTYQADPTNRAVENRVKAAAYRWLAKEFPDHKGNLEAMDIPTLRLAWVAIRSADPVLVEQCVEMPSGPAP
jgi:hypothetical protein